MPVMSERLQCILDCCESNSIADIGYDHGLVLARHARRVDGKKHVGVEVSPHFAENFHLSHGHIENIELRRGNGLDVLEPGEVETICIAGLGEEKIVDMLRGAEHIWPLAKRLIINPSSHKLLLRQYINTLEWYCHEEYLLEENNRIYTILVLEPGEEPSQNISIRRAGPRLYENQNELYKRYLDRLVILRLLSEQERENLLARV